MYISSLHFFIYKKVVLLSKGRGGIQKAGEGGGGLPPPHYLDLLDLHNCKRDQPLDERAGAACAGEAQRRGARHPQ